MYELEDNLQALVNSIDLAQEPAIREFILEKIGQEVRRVKEKRDAVMGFLRHCEQQQKFAEAEIERIGEDVADPVATYRICARKAEIDAIEGLRCPVIQVSRQLRK